MELLLFHNLQIWSIELHIAFFYQLNPLHLVTVLLVLVSALFLGRIYTLQPLLHLAYRPKRLLLALITDLPRLLLAVLGIAVLLGLLRASLHLELADFLGFEMTVLLFNREGKDVGELLTVPVHVSFANLHLDLSWDIIAVLGWFSCTDNALRTIAIILGALVPLTIEFDRVSTGYIVDDLFLHVAVGCLDISTLVIILCSHVDLVGGVANSIFAREASLDLISFFQSFVVNSFDQIAHQLVYIEADTLDISLDNTRTIIVRHGLTVLDVLCPTCCLNIRLALVLEDHFLDHMAVRILVDTIPSYVSLSYVWVILLSRSRGWILRWRRKREHLANTKQEKSCRLEHADF